MDGGLVGTDAVLKYDTKYLRDWLCLVVIDSYTAMKQGIWSNHMWIRDLMTDQNFFSFSFTLNDVVPDLSVNPGSR